MTDDHRPVHDEVCDAALLPVVHVRPVAQAAYIGLLLLLLLITLLRLPGLPC